MKKILFVIGSLQIGGAETVLVDILNNIYKEFDITLLLIEKRGELLDRLNSNVKVKYLTKGDSYCHNFFTTLYNRAKRSLIYRYLGKNKYYVRYIYKKILKEKYDSEVGFLVGIPTEIIRRSPNSSSKKITWIHADVLKKDKKTYNKYYNVYKYFDTIIGVSEESIKTFEKTFPESKGKIMLIHNFIDTEKIKSRAKEKMDINFEKDKFNFLLLGRLVSDKGFDRVINIAKEYEDSIEFFIAGDGPLKNELKADIESKNISNVKLLGLVKNPYPLLLNADAFLLSSRSEAYPTVVLEAMILDKSIIATKVSGVCEILSDYDDKLLVDNADNSLKDGIDLWLKKNNKNNKKKKDKYFDKVNEENLNKIKKILNN